MTEKQKKKLYMLVEMYSTPVLLILLGLVLVLNPDSAAAMISKVIGWIILLAGVAFGASAAISKRSIALKVIVCFALVGLGSVLLKRPLALAVSLGRIAGVFLLLRGIQDLREAMQWQSSRLTAVVTMVLGAVLIILPMTTSRLVMIVLGLLALGWGIAVLRERLGLHKRLTPPDESNIIDAAP